MPRGVRKLLPGMAVLLKSELKGGQKKITDYTKVVDASSWELYSAQCDMKYAAARKARSQKYFASKKAIAYAKKMGYLGESLCTAPAGSNSTDCKCSKCCNDSTYSMIKDD